MLEKGQFIYMDKVQFGVKWGKPWGMTKVFPKDKKKKQDVVTCWIVNADEVKGADGIVIAEILKVYVTLHKVGGKFFECVNADVRAERFDGRWTETGERRSAEDDIAAFFGL